jgi:hypothetical protein
LAPGALIQPGEFQEGGVFAFKMMSSGRSSGESDTRADLGHIREYAITLSPGNGDAMVAVFDEVRFADWQTSIGGSASIVCSPPRPSPCPALLIALLSGQKFE